GALASADDGTCVAHAAAGGSGLAGDEADDRLFHVSFTPMRRGFFCIASDFADEDDGVRVGIIVEEAHGVEERSADDRVAADTDAGGLTDAEVWKLIGGCL